MLHIIEIKRGTHPNYQITANYQQKQVVLVVNISDGFLKVIGSESGDKHMEQECEKLLNGGK